MNKSDVVKSVANISGLTQPKAEEVINAFLDTIALCLSCDEDVQLSSFGKFEVRHHKPVERRNPRTGDLVEVPAKRGIGFKPSLKLKTKLN